MKKEKKPVWIKTLDTVVRRLSKRKDLVPGTAAYNKEFDALCFEVVGLKKAAAFLREPDETS